LTRTLAKIKEDAGKISEAADILQELQVTIKIVHLFSRRAFFNAYILFVLFPI